MRLRIHSLGRLAALLSLGASVARAQSLAQRVAAAGNHAVTFHFAARPGVCGDGISNVRVGHSMFMGNYDDRLRPCEPGPVSVRLELNDGTVTRVESWVGPLRDRAATDLGAVSAPEAAAFLLDVASGGGSAAEHAVEPAVFADSAVTWPALMKIARSHSGRRSEGSDATFWLSRFAAATANGHPNSLDVGTDENDNDSTESGKESMKSQAVFVMSQLPRDEAIPGLLDIAHTTHDPNVREKALFWLGQSGDSRALDLFQQILSR